MPAIRIKEVKYTHDAMIDVILANPCVSQNELADVFGYTPAWISNIVRSDAFREMLHKRKGDMVDPLIIQSMEDRLRTLAENSIEVLEENLKAKRSSDTAVKVLELSTRALGYGAKPTVNINNNVGNFVVTMPPKSAGPGEWLAEHKPQAVRPFGQATAPAITIDQEIGLVE